MTWLFSKALVQAFENSRYSRERAAESSAATCSAGVQSAPLSAIDTAKKFSCSGKTMEFLNHSQSGMTFAHSTATNGEELLTSYLAGFHARPSALPLLDETWLKTFGRRCGASWQMSLPGLSSPRTSPRGQSKKPQLTSGLWVTKPELFPYPRQTWVQTTYGSATGYLHTPTTQANYCAASMQKWPAAREFSRVFGKPTPEIHEFLMGWPLGWTDTAPLEMDRWRQWLLSHSCFSPSNSAKEAA